MPSNRTWVFRDINFACESSVMICAVQSSNYLYPHLLANFDGADKYKSLLVFYIGRNTGFFHDMWIVPANPPLWIVIWSSRMFWFIKSCVCIWTEWISINYTLYFVSQEGASFVKYESCLYNSSVMNWALNPHFFKYLSAFTHVFWLCR